MKVQVKADIRNALGTTRFDGILGIDDGDLACTKRSEKSVVSAHALSLTVFHELSKRYPNARSIQIDYIRQLAA